MLIWPFQHFCPPAADTRLPCPCQVMINSNIGVTSAANLVDLAADLAILRPLQPVFLQKATSNKSSDFYDKHYLLYGEESHTNCSARTGSSSLLSGTHVVVREK